MNRLTLLGGGGTVYLYHDIADPEVAEKVATQRMLLDVAYPADDTIVRRIDESKWADVRLALLADGIDVVDCRTCAYPGDHEHDHNECIDANEEGP